MKRLLVHRVTVLVLIAGILSCILLALLLPPTPLGWDNDSLLHYLSLDHADHLLTTYLFAALLLAFVASLALSSWDQARLAWLRTFAPETRAEERTVEASAGELDRVARELGFRTVRRSPGCTTYALHPWAIWGSFLLHAGLLVALASFLLYVLTERQGLVRLEEGEAIPAGTPWTLETRGLLAAPFRLPVGIRLDRVDATFRDDDSLASLSAVVALVEGGDERIHDVAPNDSHYHLGYRLYHPGNLGHAFDLEATDEAGLTQRLTLHLPLPRNRWVAGYGSFREDPFPEELKAKYYLAAERDSMEDRDPLLVLRLVDRGEVLGELPLRLGERGRLGTTEVAFTGVRRWTVILFDAGTGMPSVLSGFLLMMIGALFLYGAVPRALVVREGEGRCVVGWRAFTREPELFRVELDEILARSTGAAPASRPGAPC